MLCILTDARHEENEFLQDYPCFVFHMRESRVEGQRSNGCCWLTLPGLTLTKSQILLSCHKQLQTNKPVFFAMISHPNLLSFLLMLQHMRDSVFDTLETF